MKRALLIAGLAVISFGCSSSSTTDSSSSSGGSSTSTNTLSVAYPGDLAVTSPTASSSSSSSLTISESVEALKMAKVKPPTVAAKKKHLSDLLNGAKKTDCSFTFDLTGTNAYANCYGPSLQYQNHQDGTDVTNNSDPNHPGVPILPSGDLGIWSKTESSTGEACVAARTNYLMGQIITNVNIATDMGAAILCGANVAGKKLPDKGASLDLATVAQDLMTTNNIPMTITSASMARDATDSTDGPVYTMTVAGSVSFTPQGQSAQSSTFTMTLKHVPKSETDNSTYKGRLSLKVSHGTTAASFFGLGNCSDKNSGPTATDLLDAFSIEYTKSSDTALTYLLKEAQFCGSDEAKAFDSKGNVDLSNKHDGTKKNGWANNGNYQIASFNPSDGTGSYAFAWQAGSGDGNTRVLDVTVADAGADGCGYFGYGPDIAASTGVGSVTGMICNWAGPGQTAPAGKRAVAAKAERECFKQSNGLFVVDTTTTDSKKSLAITYAPTLSCDKTKATFTYFMLDGTTGDNDSKGSTPVTNNLISWDGSLFTVPTAPSVP